LTIVCIRDKVTRIVSSIRLALLAVWCAVASVSSVSAQVGAVEITGRVKDQGGAAAPGATVTVTNVATNRQVALKLVF
jgi:hypothetical protein